MPGDVSALELLGRDDLNWMDDRVADCSAGIVVAFLELGGALRSEVVDAV